MELFREDDLEEVQAILNPSEEELESTQEGEESVAVAAVAVEDE